MKKVPLVIVVGLFLTFICLLSWLYQPRIIEQISHLTYDVFMRGAKEDPQSGRVIVVDVDEPSLDVHGQWPWPRDLIAELTQKTLDLGASVIAFDVVFAESDGKSPKALQAGFKSRYDLDINIDGVPDALTDFDNVFAGTLSNNSDRVILGCYMHLSTQEVVEAGSSSIGSDPTPPRYIIGRGHGAETVDIDVNEFLVKSKKMTISIPVLTDAAGNNAFFNAMPDDDNVVRRIPLAILFGNKYAYPSLALEALRIDQGADQVILGYFKEGLEWVQLKDFRIPTDASGQMLVNYRKLMKRKEGAGFISFPTYSAADILAGRIPREAIENKIVFVGTSAPGLRDLRTTPLAPEFAGVEVHATMVDNILSNDILIQQHWFHTVDALAILLMGIFLTVLIHKGRAIWSFVLMLVALLGSLGISYLLFKNHNTVFIPVNLAVAVAIVYPVLTMIKYWQEERERRQVRNMFGTMVSPDVLRYLEHNPESFSLSGQRAEATMFFSDVAGFTTISEALEPGQLSELLNRYLSPMTQIIMERNGYVDKYEGDAIMAEWGVPFPIGNHAIEACLAALEQQERLDELRPMLKEEFGHAIYVRMGVNSGIVTAGNMGSDRRFQYTVLGDAVNLAARLEPVNKDYGTRIVIGESTYEMASEAIEGRLLDKLVVKGKGKPICIYELLGRKGDVSDERIQLAELYAEGLRFHWTREWDKALARFDEALRIAPDDRASMTMRERILNYKLNAPSDGWAGEHVRAEKD